ncbi:hypothetical protein [Gordonibacter massiliensis (ex Traore et al. 2017)]|uniref:hypothetical protein n=1 Tax=Gordonibacter massiliensis (ex Traore et al. 2017) TaxID=1841863 RepID=UPI001C8CAA52|nr:hypothetical protein [Gordonibacter massiliensis (ex Traore et al. 2017)]MBX9033088.1 hypothetical protein [Gordonibacter massiliensis (ex Traore et al. 2017)]
MDGYVNLIVGCALFVPLIVLLLTASWKQWHGAWLGFSDVTFNRYEGRPATPLQRRRGRRAALVDLVWAVACAGILGIAAFSAASDFSANLEAVSGGALLLAVIVGCVWIGAGSRRDRRKFANVADGNAGGLDEEYALGRRGIAVLAVVMLAVLAIEIASSLIVL